MLVLQCRSEKEDNDCCHWAKWAGNAGGLSEQVRPSQGEREEVAQVPEIKGKKIFFNSNGFDWNSSTALEFGVNSGCYRYGIGTSD